MKHSVVNQQLICLLENQRAAIFEEMFIDGGEEGASFQGGLVDHRLCIRMDRRPWNE